LFKPENYPNLLVGLAQPDDAAVYQLNESQAIITTTDFFPPVVDDPYDFGAIAAANALSDIYAMGGEVLFAINLVAFPESLGMELLSEILRGGAEKVAEAGGVIAGGHSVNDKEPKYGLAVTGIIHPDKIKAKGGARPGDVLMLTKPLGVGVVTTALKREQTSDSDVAAAVANMKTLNRDAARAAQQCEAHSMTDITGFGLLGHASEMAQQGRVDFQFESAALPWLPGALGYAQAGCFPGGTKRNATHFASLVTFDDGVPPLLRDLMMTPETSGGLLVAMPADQVEKFQSLCPVGVVVGRVVSGTGRLHVR
jgi:selenide,water dikinase